MPQFLVLCYDYADAGERRVATRPTHIEQLKPMIEKGNVLCAGGILDDSGTKAVGSAFMMEMPGRAELDAWVKGEPYSKGRVWERVEIKQLRVVVRDGKLSP